MQKLTLSDIKDIATYEKERPKFQKHIIALKKRRRISVGDKVTLVFENRDTVRSQIQEMCRVERIVHNEKIQDELDTYNGLIPEPNHLAATVFIEITQLERIRKILDTLIGLDEHLAIELGEDQTIRAIFEPGRIAAVQYVSFKFSREQMEAFSNPEIPAHLSTDHPNYHATAEISSSLRQELVTDLTSIG